MLYFSKQNLASVELGDYYHYRCEIETRIAPDLPRFRFLAVTSLYATTIAEFLCDSPIMAQFYSGVTISWKPRWLLSPNEVINENYDLIWSREKALSGLVPSFKQYYQLLMALDNYKVFWFSKGASPILNQSYFENKRVGILSDRLSQTHHLLPIISLKDANIQLNSKQLIIFDDARSLYRAFAKGEIDLITGGDWLRRQIDAPLTSLLISDQVNAASLYIRKQHPIESECALIQAMSLYKQTLTEAHIQANIKALCDVN
tara:strand:+ start:367579 stop:368358 length:780 start_codon:yes stop_codon:yes gene_type:complete